MADGLRQLDWRLAPIRGGVLATFALIPVWFRLPEGLPPLLTPFYSVRFLIFLTALWTVGWWLVAGLPGFAALRRDGRRWWALALLLLALWAFASTGWAFIRPWEPDVAPNGALQLAVALLFVIAAACAGPSARAVVRVMAFSVVWNSALVFAQVARQSSVGLEGLGEFPVSPHQPGVSVLVAGSERWLRPYGLLPHPNLVGGVLAVGLLALTIWLVSARRRDWLAGTALLLVGLWALLLTFSRAAWGGLAVGALATAPLLWRVGMTSPPSPLSTGGEGEQRARSRPSSPFPRPWGKGSHRRLPGWGFPHPWGKGSHRRLPGWGFARWREKSREWRFESLFMRLAVSGALVGAVVIAFVLAYQPLLAARTGISQENVEMRSVADRMVYADLALQAIGENPVIGVGIANFPWWSAYELQFLFYDLRGDNAHNVYLQAWSELGIVGLGLLLAGHGIGVRLVWWRWRRGALDGAGVALLGAFMALAAIGLLDHYPWTLMQFQVAWWGSLACGLMKPPEEACLEA